MLIKQPKWGQKGESRVKEKGHPLLSSRSGWSSKLAVVADLQSRAGVHGRRCCYSGGFVAGFIRGRTGVCLIVYGVWGMVW
uniref:Uncharacterized protein n=1 Tax=Solanum tuberosum TaxID=4113 RepID=M1B263_SOLTU